MTADLQTLRRRRAARTRVALKKSGGGRPRLTVFRSGRHIYAQVIDDAAGTTIAAASTLDKELSKAHKTGANVAAAQAVGKLIGERAASAGVKDVVFDRGRFIFHGRVKALAEAAREAGLKF